MSPDLVRQCLFQARLYAILDTGYCEPDQWPHMAEELLSGGGVEIVQIRAKSATLEQVITWSLPVVPICERFGVPLIMNDHPSAVPIVGAAGCHVGQDDLSVAEARELAGVQAIIGKSTHSPDQALAAVREGADYIGVGPVFATPTKPTYAPVGLELVRFVARNVSLPFFCIGGIKIENLDSVLVAGATRVVIVSGLLKAEFPRHDARLVREKLAAKIV